MKNCGVVNAAIAMLFGLEYALGRTQHLAAADEIARAKLALNGPEIDIQGLVHAMVPSNGRSHYVSKIALIFT